MNLEQPENRRPWTTPQVTCLFTEQAEGGALAFTDEAGHIAVGAVSVTVVTVGALS